MTVLEVLIGAGAALAGAYLTNRHDRKMAREAEQNLLRGFLRGLYCELDTIYEIHRSEVGPKIDELSEGDPLLLFYPIGQNYFSVFDGCSDLVGRVPNHDLRTAVIRAYTASKSFVDTIHKNNDLYNDFERAIRANREASSDATKQAEFEAYQDLASYGTKVRQSQRRAYTEVDHFMALVKSRGFQPGT